MKKIVFSIGLSLLALGIATLPEPISANAESCDSRCKDGGSGCMLSFTNQICSEPMLSPCTTLECS